jgi:hypothetical protein
VAFVAPPGLTETFVTETIEHIANILGPQFTFPNFDAGDAKAQAGRSVRRSRPKRL